MLELEKSENIGNSAIFQETLKVRRENWQWQAIRLAMRKDAPWFKVAARVSVFLSDDGGLGAWAAVSAVLCLRRE